MRKKLWISLVLLLVIPGLLCIASCAKKAVKPGAVEAQAAEAAAEQVAREKIAARNMFINENVYFDFDKYNLLPLAQQILQRKAEWLRNNPYVSVIIEGHCDERGTNEYNLALGDRRAESARTYLINLGIEGSQLTTVSYGEEHPVDSGHNEVAWAKNRRAHFTTQ